MVAPTGLEPVTYRLSSDCSAIELRGYMVGRVGIEPTVFTLWVRDLQSRAFANYAYLPMYIIILEGGIGFAPMMRGLQPRALVCLANHPYGAEERNRTPNLLITSELLYQLSYLGMPGIRDYSDEIR